MKFAAEDLNKHYYLIEDVVSIVMTKTLKFNIEEINEEEFFEVEIDGFDDIKLKK